MTVLLMIRLLCSERPELSELFEKVIPHFARYWKGIGAFLKIPLEDLRVIDKNVPGNSRECFYRMLDIWLETTPSASWSKLAEAVKFAVNPECNKLTNAEKCLKEQYQETRFTGPDEEIWPHWPDKPRLFISIALVLHKNKEKSKKVVGAMARSRSKGDISTMPKVPQRSRLISLRQNMRGHSSNLAAEYLADKTINKNIADVFKPVDDSPSPRIILIDGVPGIGKTYLCKEIAYQWSQGQILTEKRFLFLLHAHDPRLQSLKHVKDLVALFCELENEETIDLIYVHIKETQGEILTIVLDGCDEFYGGLKSDHLLSRIIRCEILPKCGVVITSRSFASGSLCGQADRRLEILGFTSNDRQDYIQRALEKKPDDIVRLKQYLESHPTVDSLCYIPLNMTILLHLFTENDLPQSRTELYEKFVNLTITLHIEKYEKNKKLQKGNFFKSSIKQNLAYLSYDALRKDVVVFSYEEVSRACPEIVQNSGTIHGFGLLQVTQYFTTNGPTLSFNFAHSSVQEYLAAYYIQSLPNDRQLDLLRDTFWDERYLNTWIIYVGLTQGRSFAFKHFLSGNFFSLTSKLFKEFYIAQKILQVKINRLRLFQCFKEAKDETMCNIIGESMQNKQVDLSGETLLPNHVVTLGFFLTQSYILDWEKLDLSSCNMQNVGCGILWKELASSAKSKVHIKVINFSGNKLSAMSAHALADLVQLCETEEFYLSDNLLGDKGAKAFTTHLSSDTSLKLLLMNGNNISADVAEEIEQRITTTTSLHIVGITSHQLYVRNERGDHIAEVLRCYTALNKFSICNCPVNPERLEAILNLLVENATLHSLHLSHSGLTEPMVHLLATKLSALRGLSDLCIVEPGLFHDNQADLTDTIPVTSSVKVVIASDIKIYARHTTYLEITKLKLLPSLMVLEIPKCLPKEEKSVDSLVTALGTAPLMQEVDVSQNKLGPIGVQKIAQAIKDMPRLKSLIMRGNDINDVAAIALADSLENKIGLEILNLCANEILSTGAIVISKSLQENKTLKVLDLQNNGIELDAAPGLSCMLVSKTNLLELNLSQNSLGTEGMIIIASALQKITTLKALNVSSNKILTKASSDIAEVIKSNTSLEVLNVSLNKLESLGCIKLCKALQKQHPNLKVFNISSNGIKSMAASEIAHTLQDKQKLEVVNVSWNEFEGGLATIVASLKSTKLLRELTLRQSGIVNQKAVNKICQVINENSSLQLLDLGSTKLQNLGAYKIFGALKDNTTLKVLNVCRNNFDDSAVEQLSFSLANNSALSELLLHDNPLSDLVIKQTVFKILSSTSNLKNIWVPQINNERIRTEIDQEVEKINRVRTEDNKLKFSNW
ncbi:protein NLRC3-like [Dysidea avara]|uniref:protein NLRC3-like n=1 Tax=Dysidea avara TaxID=196820 RepID=UPI0033259867